MEQHKAFCRACFDGEALITEAASSKKLGWLTGQGLSGALLLSDDAKNTTENEYIVYVAKHEVCYLPHSFILPFSHRNLCSRRCTVFCKTV